MRVITSMLLLGASGAAMFTYAQEPRNRGAQNASPTAAAQAGNANGGEIHLLHVQGNVSMLVGAGGNITVQAGDDGILLVDTGLATMSDKVMKAIRPLSKKPGSSISLTPTGERITRAVMRTVGKVGRPVKPGALRAPTSSHL